MNNQAGVVPQTLSSLGISPEVISESLRQGVIVTNSSGDIEFVNSTFCDVTGYTITEVLGKNPRILSSGKHPVSFYREMWTSILCAGYWEGEIHNRRKNGELYCEWLAVTALKTESGSVTHFLGIFSDISKRKKVEQETWHQANHDALTGLPNRTLFGVHLRQAIARAKRERRSFAVIFLDSDHMKEVNDALGHEGGDLLLVEIGNRVKRAVRNVDVLSRFGGDEFVLLLSDAGDRSAISSTAQKVLTGLSAPFSIRGHAINASASMGISIYPEDGEDAEALIAAADRAMYSAKKAGRDRFHFATYV